MPLKIEREDQNAINLTPMIDIVFLLIIFFMVGTKFAEMERQVKLELPGVKQIGALSPIPKQRVVNVYEDDTIMMDGQEYQLNSLLTELQRAHSEYNEMSVLIRGDGEAKHQSVTNVLAACRDAGFERLGIAVRAETIRR